MAQARKATGVSSENLNAEAGTTVQDLNFHWILQ